MCQGAIPLVVLLVARTPLLAQITAVEAPPSSFSARSVEDFGKSVGFSVGVFESYGSTRQEFGEAGSQFATSVQADLFGGLGRQRSSVYWSYSSRFIRPENRNDELSHYATVNLTYRLSSRVTIALSETLDSTSNPYVSRELILAPELTQNLAFSPDVAPQRVTQNWATASLNMATSDRSSVEVFGGHFLWRYGLSDFRNNHGFQVGVLTNYQLNRWLFLNNRFSTYLNEVNESNLGVAIHRLEMGGLGFQLSRSVKLTMTAALEAAKEQGVYRKEAGGGVGLSKTSGSTALTIGYSRGFSAVAGTGLLAVGHNVTASVNQWVGRRVQADLSGYYSRSHTTDDEPLEYLAVSGGFGVALQSHLGFSARYSYTSQLAIPNASVSATDGYTVTAGLSYSLTSLLGP